MNQLHNQLFNPQYANQAYLQQLYWQQHDIEQRQEIMNAVKAIHEKRYNTRAFAELRAANLTCWQLADESRESR